MRARDPSHLALAMTLALAGVRGPADASDGGICIATSGREHASVAEAAQRTLGMPAERIDVSATGQRAALGARCARLIIAVGPEALRAAGESAPRSPVVHAMVPNRRPGGQPGVSRDADPRQVLDMLRRMAPKARRIGVVYNPALTDELVKDGRTSARALGLELLALPVGNVGEAVRAFHRFETELQVDALWLVPDGTATVQETVHYALELAHWRRMVVIGLSRWYVAGGALFALLPRPESYGAAAGELGQQMLRGGRPAGTVYTGKYALYVNSRTAGRLGLKIPPEFLESAAEVLQ